MGAVVIWLLTHWWTLTGLALAAILAGVSLAGLFSVCGPDEFIEVGGDGYSSQEARGPSAIGAVAADTFPRDAA